MDSNKENFESLTSLEIERNNFIHLTKFLVKDILRVSVKLNRRLDEDHPLIIQLLRVIECVIKHGLKPRKILTPLPIAGLAGVDPWLVILDLAKLQIGTDLIETIQQMGFKTGLCRFRAWLKLALMQKKLGNYFQFLTEHNNLLESHYYPAALLLQEGGTEIAGLLVGLSVIECNFVRFKETSTEMDSYIGPLNYSIYMKRDFDDPNIPLSESSESSQEVLQNLLDQKNYTEELNSILQTKLTKLQESVIGLEQENKSVKEKLAEMTNEQFSLNEELRRVSAERDLIREKFEHRSKLMLDDLEVERNTYQTSRQELYHLNLELEKKLKEEIQVRLDVEKSVQVEVHKRSDIELGMDTLERQIQEKQETILNLRRQLEQIKMTNIELNKDIKDKQNTIEHKTMIIEKLEDKTAGMSTIIDQMDQRIKRITFEKSSTDSVVTDLQKQLETVIVERSEKCVEVNGLQKQIHNFQDELEKFKQENTESTEQIERLNSKIEFLERELLVTKKRCHDQSEALSEMAKLVENSKLESEGLREMQASIQEARWTDDKDVNECIQCNRQFNVSRRKHHCRRCGGVFCHDCSNFKMPLASSAKPMRVCDACHNFLLQNYTSTNSKLDED